jgi:hypothetical protein
LNKFLLIIYLASWGVTSLSQPVVLKISDKVSGTAVEYAYVLARQVNGQAEDKQISNKEGEVKLNVAWPVIVTISNIGYRAYTDTIAEGESNTIMLSPDYYQLDKVVVTGQFRPQPVDKSIYKDTCYRRSAISTQGCFKCG